MRELFKSRPKLLIVQNPSLILALVACLLRPILRYRLVVDRHSNFMLVRRRSMTRAVFRTISDFTLRNSDLTIVTNDFLKNVVESKRGTAVVLQDPFPRFLRPEVHAQSPIGNEDSRTGMFVCTYSNDEPYNAVFEATASLQTAGRLIVSGRPPRKGFSPETSKWIDDGIAHIAGFMPDPVYIQTLRNADFILALTTSEHCLVCAAYEAFALDKPLILSDTNALREYFGPLPIYVDNTVEGLRHALQQAFDGNHPTSRQVAEHRAKLELAWNQRFAQLQSRIDELLEER